MRRLCRTLALAGVAWLGSAVLAELTEGSLVSLEWKPLASFDQPAELIPGKTVLEASDSDPDPTPVSSGLQLRSLPPRRERARAARPTRTAAIPLLLLTGRQNE